MMINFDLTHRTDSKRNHLVYASPLSLGPSPSRPVSTEHFLCPATAKACTFKKVVIVPFHYIGHFFIVSNETCNVNPPHFSLKGSIQFILS